MESNLLVSWLKRVLGSYLICCCVMGVVISYRWGSAIWLHKDQYVLLSCFLTETDQIEYAVQQNAGTNEPSNKNNSNRSR
jgi:hypothetical protein